MRTQCCQPPFGSIQCNDCPLTAPIFRLTKAETPRTDAICITPIMGGTVTEHKWDKLQALARSLERENAELRRKLEAVRELNDLRANESREAINRAETAERQLAEMLCIIHRDGGHYIQAHGVEKAYEDACIILHEWKVVPEQLAEERAALEIEQRRYSAAFAELQEERAATERANARYLAELERCQKEFERAEALQAKLDALMLEYCPEETTEEQKERWAHAQRKG